MQSYHRQTWKQQICALSWLPVTSNRNFSASLWQADWRVRSKFTTSTSLQFQHCKIKGKTVKGRFDWAPGREHVQVIKCSFTQPPCQGNYRKSYALTRVNYREIGLYTTDWQPHSGLHIFTTITIIRCTVTSVTVVVKTDVACET